MTQDELLAILAALSAAVSAAVELIKPGLARLGLPDQARHAVTYAAAVALGIAAAHFAGVSIFMLVERPLNPALGTIATGFVIGLGSGAVHAVYDLLYGWRDRVGGRPLG